MLWVFRPTIAVENSQKIAEEILIESLAKTEMARGQENTAFPTCTKFSISHLSWCILCQAFVHKMLQPPQPLGLVLLAPLPTRCIIGQFAFGPTIVHENVD